MSGMIRLVHNEFCGVVGSKGRKGQCLYNTKWERDPQYKDLVSALKAGNERKALCQWYNWIIDAVLDMGESALKSHSKC